MAGIFAKKPVLFFALELEEVVEFCGAPNFCGGKKNTSIISWTPQKTVEAKQMHPYFHSGVELPEVNIAAGHRPMAEQNPTQPTFEVGNRSLLTH